MVSCSSPILFQDPDAPPQVSGARTPVCDEPRLLMIGSGGAAFCTTTAALVPDMIASDMIVLQVYTDTRELLYGVRSPDDKIFIILPCAPGERAFLLYFVKCKNTKYEVGKKKIVRFCFFSCSPDDNDTIIAHYCYTAVGQYRYYCCLYYGTRGRSTTVCTTTVVVQLQ